MDNSSGIEQPLDGDGGVVGDEIAQQQQAVAGGLARNVGLVFDGQRDAF